MYVYVYVFVFVFVYVYEYVYICIYVYMYICIYVYMYICICICVHTYIYYVLTYNIYVDVWRFCNCFKMADHENAGFPIEHDNFWMGPHRRKSLTCMSVCLYVYIYL